MMMLDPYRWAGVLEKLRNEAERQFGAERIGALALAGDMTDFRSLSRIAGNLEGLSITETSATI